MVAGEEMSQAQVLESEAKKESLPKSIHEALLEMVDIIIELNPCQRPPFKLRLAMLNNFDHVSYLYEKSFEGKARMEKIEISPRTKINERFIKLLFIILRQIERMPAKPPIAPYLYSISGSIICRGGNFIIKGYYPDELIGRLVTAFLTIPP